MLESLIPELEFTLQYRSKKMARNLAAVGILIDCLVTLFIYAIDSENNLWRYFLVSIIGFLLIYILLLIDITKLARLIFCWYVPTFMLVISILDKSGAIDAGTISPVGYFDVRIMIFITLLIPIAVVSVTEVFTLVVGILPSFLYLLFFDPIHNAFGIGYFDAGLAGDNYYLFSNMFVIFSYIFVLYSALMLKFKMEKNELRMMEKKERSRMLLEKLTDLSKVESLIMGDINYFYTTAVHAINKAVKVDRVSIWEFSDDGMSIHCAKMMEDNHEINLKWTIEVNKYSDFYNALLENGRLIIDNLEESVEAKNLTDSYFKPNNITSLMAVLVKSLDKPLAIISCAVTGQQRKWSLEESIFIKSVGNLVSSVVDHRDLIDQRKLLRKMNSEIKVLNTNLELKIKERTAELERRNKQLAEYSFINAHILRGPVARLAGLYNILKYTSEEEKEDILGLMKDSIDEVDEVSKKINRSIEEYPEFSRDTIKLN